MEAETRAAEREAELAKAHAQALRAAEARAAQAEQDSIELADQLAEAEARSRADALRATR